MRAYTRVYVRIRRLSAQLFILLSPVAPSAYARIRRLSPSKFKHVELSRPAQTSAGIPANHESAARSPRADALFCIGTYADVYRRIRSPVYTFIHGATCAMQWRRAGSRKRGHLRRLPAHTRAWSINPALAWTSCHDDAIKWTHFPPALLAICAGNSPVPGEFPTQRPVTRSFDVYFDLHLNKRLSKQSRGWWFERLLCPLWRNTVMM